ncbi:MAG TPA: lipopolysaccharide heptosyltransferase II [Pirellulales bacterium]|nr:lipopolysaccharide heptosyltransferase II [Pirellulales bacterium]
MKLAVFLPNWIGDVVMATPTLRALRHRFPQARILGVMRPYVADVLAGTRWLDDAVFFDHRSENAYRRMPSVARQLRAERIDTAVLLTNSWRTGLLARWGGARERVGYARGGRGWLLSTKLRPPRQGRRYLPSPVLDYYLELAYALGCPAESPRMELAVLGDDRRAAASAWSRLGLDGARSVIALNSGGAFGAAKLWPTEYFAELARELAGRGHAVLVLCGPSERAIAAEIVRSAGDRRVASLADEPMSIGLTKACLERTRLLVTTDSGPRHLAAALGVPSVSLFGPTHIAWSDNHAATDMHVQLKLECQPCQQRVCPLKHHRCMRELSVERVMAAVVDQLRRTEHADAA